MDQRPPTTTITYTSPSLPAVRARRSRADLLLDDLATWAKWTLRGVPAAVLIAYFVANPPRVDLTEPPIVIPGVDPPISTQEPRAESPSGSEVIVPFTPYYRDCAEARALGVAPISRDDPGYRASLDQDNDGTACDEEQIFSDPVVPPRFLFPEPSTITTTAPPTSAEPTPTTTPKPEPTTTPETSATTPAETTEVPTPTTEPEPVDASPDESVPSP